MRRHSLSRRIDSKLPEHLETRVTKKIEGREHTFPNTIVLPCGFPFLKTKGRGNHEKASKKVSTRQL